MATGPAAESDAVRRDGQRLVADAVRHLPDRQRSCVVLWFYAEMSDAEIAETLASASAPSRPTSTGRVPRSRTALEALR